MRRKQVTEWIVAKNNPPSVIYAAQTAIGAVASYLIAGLFRLPEAYWAPMSTLIVVQTTLNAALPISAQHFAGTAMGAGVGALTAVFFGKNVWSFGIAVLVTGLLCALLGIERSAYRYASITLVIVMLVSRSNSAQLVAIHRFFEVSIGILVGLLLFVVWPLSSKD